MAASSSSHLVLARKWRPERFSELAGQEHVTRTLAQALKSGRIAHAFLFTGIRGVGKTTAARILARCLNCAEGPTAEPCGNCAACGEIRAGASLDVVEIDGATYRKIDDARAIIENLGYRPARDRYKIYIIDEAHQLTDQAFNALLKTLEEPPPHVKFILATTEPQKMPETILSRLQRYDFRRIPFAVIFARLKELATREAVQADDAALRMLAREAGGSMRDAERMLETAIASLDGAVTETGVATILGVAGRSRTFAIVEAVLAKQAAAALATVRELHRSGANLESLGRDLLEMLRNLAVASLPVNGGASPLDELPDQEAAELRRLAATASVRDLMRLFNLMADAQERLLRSPYPDLLLEMAVIRMAMLAPVVEADELLRTIKAAGGTVKPNPRSPAGSAPPAASGGGAAPPKGITSAAPPSVPSAAALDEVPVPVGARALRVEGEVKADAPLKPVTAMSPDLPELRDFIRSRRAALAGFMEQGAALSLDGETLTITPRNDIYIRYLSDNRAVIAQLASELLGRSIRAEMGALGEMDTFRSTLTAANATPPGASPAPDPSSARNGAPPDAPAAAQTAPAATIAAVGRAAASPTGTARAADAISPAAMRQALYNDPVVKRIFEEFQARLVEVREPPAAAPSSPPPIK